MLSWIKIRRLPPTRSEKKDISTTSGPTSLLQKKHLALDASVIADDN
jgi:hypothetical protein